MGKVFKVAIAGLGTVGGGAVKLLKQNAEEISNRCGKKVEIVALCSRRKTHINVDFDVSDIPWYDDAVQMAKEVDADAIVELIGGSEGVAREVCETAIKSGKSLVTANKALLAMHGNELAKLADDNNVNIAYEAAVAGGIPIIKSIREGLAGNKILSISGILNGTCNYILTTMKETGRGFDDVLAEAQAKGYAEADPSFDVDGIDTAHKTAILAALAFGVPIDFGNTYVEGIRKISARDIANADEFGYKIKLLGIAKVSDKGIEQRVHPCFVPKDEPIANVDGVFNAVVVKGDFVGTSLFAGRGAGERPTASSVVSDIIDLARGHDERFFGLSSEFTKVKPISTRDDFESSYYIDLEVEDKSGVVADIGKILKEENLSIEKLIQRGRGTKESNVVNLVMILHSSKEGGLIKAIEKIKELSFVVAEPKMIRVFNS